MPKIVLVSGKARHGKDTFADLFKKAAEQNGKKVLIIRYGDILKHVCKTYFGWDGVKDLKGRTLLQQIGTETMRTNNPDVWVNCMIELVKGFGNLYDYIVIPDTRFPNEIYRWMGGQFDCVTVRVNRVNSDNTLYDNKLTEEQKNHLSEIALDECTFDYIIQNRKLIDFGREVIRIYNELEEF